MTTTLRDQHNRQDRGLRRDERAADLGPSLERARGHVRRWSAAALVAAAVRVPGDHSSGV